jgi:nicotinamidase-related amidase
LRRALIVVDVQCVFMEKKLYDKEGVVATIGKAISSFRGSGGLIVFVQHRSKIAPRGTQAWAIYSGLDRRAEDPVIEKEHGDAFQDTGLKRVLEEWGWNSPSAVGRRQPGSEAIPPRDYIL